MYAASEEAHRIFPVEVYDYGWAILKKSWKRYLLLPLIKYVFVLFNLKDRSNIYIQII